MLCMALGMALGTAPTEREDHAADVENSLTTLPGDKLAIFQAASSAQVASNLILSVMAEYESERAAA